MRFFPCPYLSIEIIWISLYSMLTFIGQMLIFYRIPDIQSTGFYLPNIDRKDMMLLTITLE